MEIRRPRIGDEVVFGSEPIEPLGHHIVVTPNVALADPPATLAHQMPMRSQLAAPVGLLTVSDENVNQPSRSKSVQCPVDGRQPDPVAIPTQRGVNLQRAGGTGLVSQRHQDYAPLLCRRQPSRSQLGGRIAGDGDCHAIQHMIMTVTFKNAIRSPQSPGRG
jgi:hypothetical protein